MHEFLADVPSKYLHLAWLPERTIYLTRHGSYARGLQIEGISDIDLRGICIAPKKYYLGFNNRFEQLEATQPDATIFEIRKFFNLTSQCNPNCLEWLYTLEDDHYHIDELGQILIDNRDQFLSKQVKERYIGYAKSQAYRIKSHRGWLMSDMSQSPTRENCGLPPRPLIEKNQLDAVKAMIRKQLDEWNPDFEPFSDSQKIYLQGKVSDILTEMHITTDDKWAAGARKLGLDDNLIHIIKQEKEFENKCEQYKSYLKWKANRNPKRAEMEAKYKFDVKHGTMLCLLLRMGIEILETGQVNVRRTHDREELMAIKTGAWTYEQLIEYADKLEDECKEAYKNSKLPNQPNIKYLDQLCQELVERSWAKYEM